MPRPSGSVDLTGEDWVYTFYVCDASGNLMSTYQLTHDQVTNSDAYTLRENYLYGSKRLGQNARNVLMAGGGTIGGNSDAGNRRTGRKAYELTNHLGNVLSTISDRKLGVDDGTGNLSYYQTDITSWSDYYAFGMQMPGRVGQNAYYRYAFNGMEQDPEWSGEGNSYTTEFRHYDPRLGRWRSLDPLMAKFPYMSPYVSFDNNPILYVDPLGLSSRSGSGGEGEPEPGYACTDECGRHLVYVGNDEWSELPEGTWFAEGTGYIVPDHYNGPGTAGYDYSVDRNQTFGDWYTEINNKGIGYTDESGEVTLAVNTGQANLMLAWMEGMVEGFARPYWGVVDAYLTAELAMLAGSGTWWLAKTATKFSYQAQSRLIIYQAMKNPKLNVQIMTSADDIAYLEMVGEAKFMVMEGGEGVIYMLEGANKIVVLEEVIHFNQFMKYGEKAFLANRTALEIEAQKELLRIGTLEGWAIEEMQRIQRALIAWQKLAAKEAAKAVGY